MHLSYIVLLTEEPHNTVLCHIIFVSFCGNFPGHGQLRLWWRKMIILTHCNLDFITLYLSYQHTYGVYIDWLYLEIFYGQAVDTWIFSSQGQYSQSRANQKISLIFKQKWITWSLDYIFIHRGRISWSKSWSIQFLAMWWNTIINVNKIFID